MSTTRSPDNLETLQDELTKFVKRNKQLRLSLTAHKKTVDQLEKNNKKLLEENKSLLEGNKNCLADMKRLQQENEKLKNQAQASDQHDNLEKIKFLKTQVAKQEEEITSSHERVKTLTETIETIQSEIEKPSQKKEPFEPLVPLKNSHHNLPRSSSGFNLFSFMSRTSNEKPVTSETRGFKN